MSPAPGRRPATARPQTCAAWGIETIDALTAALHLHRRGLLDVSEHLWLTSIRVSDSQTTTHATHWVGGCPVPTAAAQGGPAHSAQSKPLGGTQIAGLRRASIEDLEVLVVERNMGSVERRRCQRCSQGSWPDLLERLTPVLDALAAAPMPPHTGPGTGPHTDPGQAPARLLRFALTWATWAALVLDEGPAVPALQDKAGVKAGVVAVLRHLERHIVDLLPHLPVPWSAHLGYLRARLGAWEPDTRPAAFARSCWVLGTSYPLPEHPAFLAQHGFWTFAAAAGSTTTPPVSLGANRVAYRVRHHELDQMKSWSLGAPMVETMFEGDVSAEELAQVVQVATGDAPDRFSRALAAIRATAT